MANVLLRTCRIRMPNLWETVFKLSSDQTSHTSLQVHEASPKQGSFTVWHEGVSASFCPLGTLSCPLGIHPVALLSAQVLKQSCLKPLGAGKAFCEMRE